jgi:hypothetical protein
MLPVVDKLTPFNEVAATPTALTGGASEREYVAAGTVNE